jgi:predicted RNA-binding protein with PIN domain
MKIIIDGYNLIFECGLHGRHVNGASLARARDLLQGKIRRAYCEAERQQIVVVFDAERIPLAGQQGEEISAGIRVMYSIDFEDADAMIEFLIEKHPSPKQLLIVSSDHRLQRAAQKRRASAIDSGDWYDELERLEKAKELKGENAGRESSEPKISSDLFSAEELDIFKADVNQQVAKQKRREWRR